MIIIKHQKKKINILSKHIVDFKNNNSALDIAKEMVKDFKKRTTADQLSAYFLYSIFMVCREILFFFKTIFRNQTKNQTENAFFKKILKKMKNRSKKNFSDMEAKEISEKFNRLSKILKIESKEKKISINKIAKNVFMVKNTILK